MSRLFSLYLLISFFVCTASAQVKFSEQDLLVGQRPNSVAIGDFNLDGYPDLAVSDPSSNRIRTFNTVTPLNYVEAFWIPANNPNEVEVGYLHTGNTLDLVFGSSTASTLKVYINQGGNPWTSFVYASTVYLAAPNHNFAVGDFDGDGVADLVVHACTVGANPTCSVKTYRNDGTGKFNAWKTLLPAATTAQPSALRSVNIADFNGDGKLDVEIATISGFQIFLGNGDGSFIARKGRSNSVAGSLAIGNFNHDDNLDTAQGFPHLTDVLLNDGKATFTLHSSNPDGGSLIGAGDLTGHGADDLVVSDPNAGGAGLQYLINHGDATFGVPQTVLYPTEGGLTPIVRDLNLDGRNDIIFPRPAANSVKILRNDSAAVPCAPPHASGVIAQLAVCAPGSNATVAKTFHVKAAGNAASGVERMEIWVDGMRIKRVFEDKFDVLVSVAAGPHQLVVTAFDRFGHSSRKMLSITAQ